MSARVRVIVNPAAGRGRGARVLPSLRERFAAVGVTDLLATAAKGEERAIARRAIDEGCSTLVAVGGDGTWSNVAAAILETGSDCRLALIAVGTGNDFAKTVGAPAHDVGVMARLAVDGSDVRVDVGRVEGTHFLNVCGFGFDAAVIEEAERSALPLGGALYPYTALRQLFRYRGIDVCVRSSEGWREQTRYLMLAVANARHFGGTFRIAPGASLTDGRLDAIAIRDAPPLRRLRLFVDAMRGAHIGRPEVVAEQLPSLRLRFREPPAYEADGEYHHAASGELEITCVPRALRVVTGPPDGGVPA